VNYTCCAGRVRHQGQCGACYAFSTADTVATIQTLYSSIALPHFPLAPQELVSHSHIDTFGCNGGTFNGSYSYIKSYGINYEMNYEYKNEHSTSAIPGVLPLAAWKVSPNEIASWDFIAPNCASLLHILKKKPVTVAVSALEMQLYYKGTLSGAGGALNHGVMVVGYHPESGFWVKNSWGVLWSSYGGYAWFSKEEDDNLGLCEYGVNIQMNIEQG
jgi:cathepsin O